MSDITAGNTLDTLKKHILVDGFPVVIDFEKSRGCHLIDAQSGKRYFDFFSFFASNPLGFNHPRMNEGEFLHKLQRAARIKPTLSDMYSAEYAEFVETFVRLGQRGVFKHYFFIEGGALGVENALKTAFDWKVRKNLACGKGEKGAQVIHFRQAFHGRTGYTMSLTNTDQKKIMYYPKFQWPRITNPKLRFPVTADVLKDVEATEAKALGEIRQAFESNRDDIACMILEPIQSEGGDNHFRPEFLQSLRRVCDENEALLIFDEVQTGVGLTGSFWAFEQLGVTPDIIAFGKKIQVGGIATTGKIDEVDSVFKVPSRINSTFGGNLTDMVRATQYLRIIEDEKLVQNAKTQGEYLLKELLALGSRYPQMTNLRGRGLLVAFDLPTAEERDQYRRMAWDLGLLVLTCGERSIRLRPVLDIKKEDIDEALGLFTATFKKLYS